MTDRRQQAHEIGVEEASGLPVASYEVAEFANARDIRKKYGPEGLRRIVDMGYEYSIMKNYKSDRFIGIDNYYPENLSVEDINDYILEVTSQEDVPGINNRVFKTFKCENCIQESDDYNELCIRIRNRQLFETKLGIRDTLSHSELDHITTMDLNNEDLGVRTEVMEREAETLPLLPSLPNANALPEAESFFMQNVDLIRMRHEQDEWFRNVAPERMKKIICINVPLFAVGVMSIVACTNGPGVPCIKTFCNAARGAPAALGGKKKRKSKRRKTLKKKKRKTKRRKSLKKKQRKTKRKSRR
jgi:hypothetical protein